MGNETRRVDRLMAVKRKVKRKKPVKAHKGIAIMIAVGKKKTKVKKNA